MQEKELFPKGDKPEFSYEKCETIEQLADYLKRLVEYKHNYNTCGYAITKGLLATEQFFAHVLGTTGFQHGYAQNAFLAETRGSKLGIITLDMDEILYPQYDLVEKIRAYVEEAKHNKTTIDFAKEKIKEDNNSTFKADPNVRKRWEELASMEIKA